MEDLTIILKDGGKYTGELENKIPHGFGKCIYTKQVENLNERRTGTVFSNGNAYIFPNGRTYTGYWKNGKRHGHGICTKMYHKYYNFFYTYNGYWKDDKQHGHGSCVTSSIYKQKYVGEWKNGKEYGQGVYTNGRKKISGRWVDGSFVKGTYIFPNKVDETINDVYIGEIGKHSPINRGTYAFSDGIIITGEWKIPSIH